MIRIAALSLILLVPAPECWGIDAIDKGAVIRPGSGIGDIMIGDDLRTVLRKLEGKKPTEGKTVTTGNLVEYWLSYSELGVTFIFDQSRKLSRIAVTNPAFYVEQNGVRPKSSAANIDKSFGSSKVNKLNDGYEQRIYREKGLSVTIDRNTNKIDTITIIAPFK